MKIELAEEYEELLKELAELRGTDAKAELERAIDYYYLLIKTEQPDKDE